MKNPLENLMSRKEKMPVEESKEMKEERVTNFFKQKMKETTFTSYNLKKSVFDEEKSLKDNVYKKPYAQAYSYVDFGEALREIGVGQTETAINLLNEMINKAIQIDPTWPDIEEMRGIIKDIESLKKEKN